MIQNIKGLLRIKDDISEVQQKLEINKTAVDELTKSMSGLRMELGSVKEGYTKMMEDLQEQFQGLANFKQDLDQELYEFKLLKNDLQRKILAKFEEELNKELKTQMENLGKEASNYEELKQKIAVTAARTERVTQELDKFMEISRNIKAKDFEMEKFATELLKRDQEKLELMRKIDTLERMLASMQRRR